MVKGHGEEYRYSMHTKTCMANDPKLVDYSEGVGVGKRCKREFWGSLASMACAHPAYPVIFSCRTKATRLALFNDSSFVSH